MDLNLLWIPGMAIFGILIVLFVFTGKGKVILGVIGMAITAIFSFKTWKLFKGGKNETDPGKPVDPVNRDSELRAGNERRRSEGNSEIIRELERRREARKLR